MDHRRREVEAGPVALLAEGVDRNASHDHTLKNNYLSPSSRRAWIEIVVTIGQTVTVTRRPPRGGRG